jgi:hypothetical protein
MIAFHWINSVFIFNHILQGVIVANVVVSRSLPGRKIKTSKNRMNKPRDNDEALVYYVISIPPWELSK